MNRRPYSTTNCGPIRFMPKARMNEGQASGSLPIFCGVDVPSGNS